MQKQWIAVAAIGAVSLCATTAAAQDSTRVTSQSSGAIETATPDSSRHAAKIKDKHKLMSQATISSDSAQLLALTKVPDGTVTSGELEKSKGRLVYEVNVSSMNKKGVERVWVDAKTGEVIQVKHMGGVAGKVKRHTEKDKLEDAKEKAKKNP
jgi:uncharacterized membrane protein YkoI